MALFRFLLFILITSYHHVVISSSANDATDLIQQTCKNTQHYDLCVSSLKSSSLAPSTKVDAKGLALIMVNIAIANATATSSYIAYQMKGLGGNALMMGAMKECGDKYGFAKDALENSAVDLNGERYDYAYMHVMAAGDYPSGCRSAFRGCPGLVYPAQLALREEGLKHICDVVLGIVDSLGF